MKVLSTQRAVGAGHFGEEFAELAGVFDAGARFDTAGDVDGVGADGEDGFADVFGSEAACENDLVFCRRSLRDGPVERFAGAAELFFFRGCVEKEVGRAAESSEIGHGKTGADAKSSDDRQIVLEIVQLLRRFVSVELDAGQLECVDKIHNDFGFPIDEDADCFRGWKHFAANVPGVSGSDRARRFFIEIEANRPGTELFGEARVLRASDAADFDERRHYFPSSEESAAAGSGASISRVPIKKAS